MKTKNWNFEEALKYVKRKRSFVDPNCGFRIQLLTWRAENMIYDENNFENALALTQKKEFQE
jgi:hypothetical protein